MRLDACLVDARDTQRQGDVVERRQVFDQAEILEHDADAPAQHGELIARQVRHVLVEEMQAAGGRPLGAIDEAQKRRLAGAARAGEIVERARVKPQGDVAQHLRSRAVAHRDILEPNQARFLPREARWHAGGTAVQRDSGACGSLSLPRRPGGPYNWRGAMIVTCPSCSVRYLVDARALGPHGRTVRCARCAHTWREVPPADQLQAVVDALPQAEAASAAAGPTAGTASIATGADVAAPAGEHLRARAELAAEGRIQLPALPKKRRRWGLVLLRTAAAVAIVAGLGYSAVVERDRVVAFVPSAAKLYQFAGFPVGAETGGLEFENVTTSREMENGLPALVIEGQVKNVSSTARAVPKLVVILRDKGERDLQDLTVAPPAGRLNPGESVPFRTTISQPAEAASGVVVTFAGADRS